MFVSETIDHNKVAVISRGFIRIRQNKEWLVPVQGGQEGKRNRRALQGDERGPSGSLSQKVTLTTYMRRGGADELVNRDSLTTDSNALTR